MLRSGDKNGGPIGANSSGHGGRGMGQQAPCHPLSVTRQMPEAPTGPKAGGSGRGPGEARPRFITRTRWHTRNPGLPGSGCGSEFLTSKR